MITYIATRVTFFIVAKVDCPAGWEGFRGSCYRFVADEMKTWAESRRDCQNRGGDLVIIENSYQQAYLTRKIKGKRSVSNNLWNLLCIINILGN